MNELNTVISKMQRRTYIILCNSAAKLIDFPVHLPRLALLFLTVLERQVSHFLVSLGYPGRAGVAER